MSEDFNYKRKDRDLNNDGDQKKSDQPAKDGRGDSRSESGGNKNRHQGGGNNNRRQGGGKKNRKPEDKGGKPPESKPASSTPAAEKAKQESSISGFVQDMRSIFQPALIIALLFYIMGDFSWEAEAGLNLLFINVIAFIAFILIFIESVFRNEIVDMVLVGVALGVIFLVQEVIGNGIEVLAIVYFFGSWISLYASLAGETDWSPMVAFNLGFVAIVANSSEATSWVWAVAFIVALFYQGIEFKRSENFQDLVLGSLGIVGYLFFSNFILVIVAGFVLVSVIIPSLLKAKEILWFDNPKTSFRFVRINIEVGIWFGLIYITSALADVISVSQG